MDGSVMARSDCRQRRGGDARRCATLHRHSAVSAVSASSLTPFPADGTRVVLPPVDETPLELLVAAAADGVPKTQGQPVCYCGGHFTYSGELQKRTRRDPETGEAVVHYKQIERRACAVPKGVHKARVFHAYRATAARLRAAFAMSPALRAAHGIDNTPAAFASRFRVHSAYAADVCPACDEPVSNTAAMAHFSKCTGDLKRVCAIATHARLAAATTTTAAADDASVAPVAPELLAAAHAASVAVPLNATRVAAFKAILAAPTLSMAGFRRLDRLRRSITVASPVTARVETLALFSRMAAWGATCAYAASLDLTALVANGESGFSTAVMAAIE